MREKIIEILSGIKPGVDFDAQKNLVVDGIIDSFAIIGLVSELNDEFDIEITVADILPENFNSVDAITALVERVSD